MSRAVWTVKPLDVLAVLVGGPDVAKISEGDLAGVIIGIAHQLRLAGRCELTEMPRSRVRQRRMRLIMDVVPKGC